MLRTPTKITLNCSCSYLALSRYIVIFIITTIFYCGHPVYSANTIQYSGLPLFYWQENPEVNFGDYISLKIVERIVNSPVKYYVRAPSKIKDKKLLGLGSILYFARENDVVWGSGVNGKTPHKKDYLFSHLDVRAVRGPVTREFLMKNFNIAVPEIYGDPALLFPYLFPEFKRKSEPSRQYIVIPHFSEEKCFPRFKDDHIVYPTDPWDEVLEKILDSEFVISSSLHGIVLAEAYGIPARLLRITENESFMKYLDYYSGTNRPNFEYATSIKEALQMGGEAPGECDLQKLYDSFPFDYWPNNRIKHMKITKASK